VPRGAVSARTRTVAAHARHSSGHYPGLPRLPRDLFAPSVAPDLARADLLISISTKSPSAFDRAAADRRYYLLDDCRRGLCVRILPALPRTTVPGRQPGTSRDTARNSASAGAIAGAQNAAPPPFPLQHAACDLGAD